MKIESFNFELQPTPHYIVCDNNGRVHNVYHADIAEYMHQLNDNVGETYSDLERVMVEVDTVEVLLHTIEAIALNSDTYKANRAIISAAVANDRDATTYEVIYELKDLIQSFAAHKTKVDHIPLNTLTIRSRHFILFHNQTEYKIVNKLYV